MNDLEQRIECQRDKINAIIKQINDGVTYLDILNDDDNVYIKKTLIFIKERNDKTPNFFDTWFNCLSYYVNTLKYTKDQIIKDQMSVFKDFSKDFIVKTLDAIILDDYTDTDMSTIQEPTVLYNDISIKQEPIVLYNDISIIQEPTVLDQVVPQQITELINNNNDNENDNDTDTDISSTETDYDTEIDNDELHVVINNVFFRKNQLDAINKMKEQKFISGINCQIMGAGKSYIILNTIWEHYKMYPFKKIYIILTERIEILRKWFKKPVYGPDGNVIDYVKDDEKFNQWTTDGIIDTTQFNFVEHFDDKSDIKFNFEDKPTIFVCNNAFMKAQDRYQQIKINKIALILIDECHSVHDRNHFMLMYFKKKNINIIGFSATPVRSDKKSKHNLAEIYSNNGDLKINLISNYTLIDALQDNIVLPFKHYILNPKYDDRNKNIISEQFLKHIYDKYIINNLDLPFKKGVGWVRNINCIRENSGKLLLNIRGSFTGFDILKTYSKSKNGDGINEIDAFYDKQINSLLLCVNRCKEGSDIKFLDFAMFLDSVKSRSINVWLQMAGRIMRPDNEDVNLRRKKYAIILECLKLDEDKNIPIELITVDRIMNYYNMILNLSSYEVNDSEHIELMNKFRRLYENTYINLETNQIEIDLLGNGQNKCIIQFDETTIDWSIFQDFLRAEVNEKIQRTKDDDFNETINIIKTLDVFQQDVNFWTEYAKLDHHSLKIMNIEMLKNNYMDIWNIKTWYDVLNTKNKYMSYAELQTLLIKKYSEYDTMDIELYNMIQSKNSKLPIYPLEYYKFNNVQTYVNLKHN